MSQRRPHEAVASMPLTRSLSKKPPCTRLKSNCPVVVMLLPGAWNDCRCADKSVRRVRLPSSKPVASIDYDGKIDARNRVEIAKVDSGSGRRALSRPG